MPKQTKFSEGEDGIAAQFGGYFVLPDRGGFTVYRNAGTVSSGLMRFTGERARERAVDSAEAFHVREITTGVIPRGR